MVKCPKCGAGWTSPGLPMCPLCGAKVAGQAATAVLEPPKEKKMDLEVPEIQPDVPVLAGLPAADSPPARSMRGPFLLGLLAFVPVVMVPLTVAYESNRVLGVLGFCLSGFFAPFAPIAWMVGLGAEKREGRSSAGRALGQAATLLLVVEITAALVAIAALRLSGRFPSSFWAYF